MEIRSYLNLAVAIIGVTTAIVYWKPIIASIQQYQGFDEVTVYQIRYPNNGWPYSIVHVVNRGRDTVVVDRVLVNDRVGVAPCDRAFGKPLKTGDEVVMLVHGEMPHLAGLGDRIVETAATISGGSVESCGDQVVKVDVYSAKGFRTYEFPAVGR